VEAKVLIEQWRQHYSDVRLHSSLGYLTPNEFVRKIRLEEETGGRSQRMNGPKKRGRSHRAPNVDPWRLRGVRDPPPHQ